MKMLKHEMPFRLRALMPAFATDTGNRKDTPYRRQVEGLAEFLDKQPRTIEAYLSLREDRMISADDYWRVAVEWVKRKSKSAMSPGFIVYDENGDQLFGCQTPGQARFLADVEGSNWAATRREAWQVMDLSEAEGRRSRLRRLIRDGIVQKHVVCAVFGFDQHCLVDFQLEEVDWLSTPNELPLHQLENFARLQIGEAA